MCAKVCDVEVAERNNEEHDFNEYLLDLCMGIAQDSTDMTSFEAMYLEDNKTKQWSSNGKPVADPGTFMKFFDLFLEYPGPEIEEKTRESDVMERLGIVYQGVKHMLTKASFLEEGACCYALLSLKDARGNSEGLLVLVDKIGIIFIAKCPSASIGNVLAYLTKKIYESDRSDSM